jgi:DNA-binding response OmpR family regulator
MRILLVEDEVKLAKATKRALEPKVDNHDGDTGYGCATERYDLLILDLMLLDGGNLSPASTATSLPDSDVDCQRQTHDKTNGLDSGADDYMVKPFAMEEFSPVSGPCHDVH